MLDHEETFMDAPVQIPSVWRHKQRGIHDVLRVVFFVGWLGRAVQWSDQAPDPRMIKLSVVIYGQRYYSIFKAFFSDLSAFLPSEFNHFPAAASRAGLNALLNTQQPPAHILIHILAHITRADLHKCGGPWCDRSPHASNTDVEVGTWLNYRK